MHYTKDFWTSFTSILIFVIYMIETKTVICSSFSHRRKASLELQTLRIKHKCMQSYFWRCKVSTSFDSCQMERRQSNFRVTRTLLLESPAVSFCTPKSYCTQVWRWKIYAVEVEGALVAWSAIMLAAMVWGWLTFIESFVPTIFSVGCYTASRATTWNFFNSVDAASESFWLLEGFTLPVIRTPLFFLMLSICSSTVSSKRCSS